MTTNREPKDKIAVILPADEIGQGGTDMYKSAAIDSTISLRTVKKVYKGTTSFRIDAIQDIVSPLGLRYFLFPFRHSSALARVIAKYFDEKEACWMGTENDIAEIIANLLTNNAFVDGFVETVTAEKVELLSVLGYAQAEHIPNEHIIDVLREARRKLIELIIDNHK